MNKRIFVWMIVFALCLTACGPGTPETPTTISETIGTTPPATDPPAPTDPTQPSQPITPPDPEPVITQITMTFTGDCTFGRNQRHTYADSFDQYYDKYGADYFLSDVKQIFENDDITVVNLEGSLTTSTDIQDKKWNHKGRPEYVQILTGASVEVAGMGNNHRIDYGISGCEETVQVLNEAGVAWCYDENYLIYEVKGVKVGFVSVNEVYDETAIEVWLEEGYEYLRQSGCAIVVALVHWGETYVIEPAPYMMDLGHRLIDMGYDLVLGNHAHILQGMEMYNGRMIVYSLGNFCYGGNKNPTDKDSGIFQQTFTLVDGELVLDADIRFIPCALSSVSHKNDYHPVVLKDQQFQRVIEKINGYSEQFGFAWNSDGTLNEEE